jgi:hypothetical protein
VSNHAVLIVCDPSVNLNKVFACSDIDGDRGWSYFVVRDSEWQPKAPPIGGRGVNH